MYSNSIYSGLQVLYRYIAPKVYTIWVHGPFGTVYVIHPAATRIYSFVSAHLLFLSIYLHFGLQLPL